MLRSREDFTSPWLLMRNEVDPHGAAFPRQLAQPLPGLGAVRPTAGGGQGAREIRNSCESNGS